MQTALTSCLHMCEPHLMLSLAGSSISDMGTCSTYHTLVVSFGPVQQHMLSQAWGDEVKWMSADLLTTTDLPPEVG